MDALSSPVAEPRGSRLAALDGLRGTAAIIVLMFHFEQLQGIRGLFAYGYLAVDFFFLLSGFVLVGPFENRAAKPGTRDEAMIAARFLRFWPLMALGALIGAGEHLLRWPATQVLPLLVLGWLSIPLGLGGSGYFALNGPQWSLFVELVCNALHVVLLRHLKVPALLALSLACAMVLAWTGREMGALALGSDYDDMLLGLLRAGFAYPLGIVLGRRQDWLRTLPLAPAWLAPAVLTGAILAFAPLALPQAVAESLICGLFVVALVAGIRAKNTARAAASLTWLGAISFPLYAVHFPILETADMVRRAAPSALGPAIFVGGLVLALALAHALSHSWLARGVRPPSWVWLGAGPTKSPARGG